MLLDARPLSVTPAAFDATTGRIVTSVWNAGSAARWTTNPVSVVLLSVHVRLRDRVPAGSGGVLTLSPAGGAGGSGGRSESVQASSSAAPSLAPPKRRRSGGAAD